MNSLLGILLWQVLLLGAPGLLSRLALGLHSDLTYLLTLPGCLVILATAWRGKSPRIAFALAGALNVLGLVVVYEYHRRSNMDLNAALALEAGVDALSTVLRSLSARAWAEAAALLLGTTAFTFLFYLFALDFGTRAIDRAPPRHARPLALLLAVITGLFLRSGWSFARDMMDLRAAVREIAARVPPAPPMRTADSVIVLHLESVNAGGMFEHVGANDFRFREPFPGLESLWRSGGGTLYPFFWSNTFATNRGIESLLCGVTGNLGRDMGAGKRPDARCLPELLRERGYRTPYYYSFFDVDFYDFKHFLPALGFSEIVYGSSLMREGDVKFAWGYDDCTFYDRLGEKFAADDGQPFFAYVEVSMHHAPFDGERRYPEVWPHPNPIDYRERYVNSLAEQDHCLPRFAKALARLKQKPHVFVVGDHSVPIEKTFSLEDRFMTTLLYLPPEGEKARAVATEAPPSQADLYATIVDLLYGVSAPNSFAGALRGGDAPAICATLANQYGVLAYARPRERARYTLEEGRATIQTRDEKGWAQRDEDIGFARFIERYSCQR